MAATAFLSKMAGGESSQKLQTDGRMTTQV